MDFKKPLYKSTTNKMIDGVCGGIGEYFGIDPTLVRLGFVALCVLAGGGLLAYIVALIIIPRAPEGYDPAAQEAPKADSAQKAPKADQAHTPDSNANSESGESDENSGNPTMI